MTKKDYKLIAEVLKELLPECPSHDEQWGLTVEHFANALEKTNPRFDRTKFLEACGYFESEK